MGFYMFFGAVLYVFTLVHPRPVAILHHQDPPIAHRDLKLENYLQAKNGSYKLCDFGSCVEGPQSLETKVLTPRTW